MKQPTSEWTGPRREPSPQGGGVSPLALDLVDDTAMLTYEGPDQAGLGTHRFLVELGDAPSTGDASRPPRLNKRRGNLCVAMISCPQASAGKWIGQRIADSAADEDTLGFRDIQLLCNDVEFAILGQAGAGPHTADFLFRGEIVPWGPRWVRVSLSDLRVYGTFPVAAPLLSAALLRKVVGVLASPSTPTTLWPTARRGGCTELVVDALGIALLHTFPVHGYRLPAVDAASLGEIVVAGQDIALHFELSGRKPDQRRQSLGVPPLADLTPLMQVDEEILGLGAKGAMEQLRTQRAERPDDLLLLERLIQLSCTDANHDAETLQLCADARSQGMDSTQLLLAEASVQLRRGRADEATLCFGGLAELAARLGDPVAELQASVAASRCATYDRADEALAYATRALSINGEHRGALRQLARLYASTRQWEDLAALRLRLLELAESDADRLRQHLALGELHRLHLGQPETAQHHYNEALCLDEASEPALRGAADAKAEMDEVDGAIGLLQRLCEVARHKQHAETEAAAHVRIATLLEQIEQYDAALTQLEQAHQVCPTHQQALLRMAPLLIATSRPEGALEVLGQVLEVTTEPAERAAVYRKRAEIYMGPLANLDRAHGETLHALALKSPSPGQGTGGDATERRAKASRAAWEELAELLRQRCSSLEGGHDELEQRLMLAAVLEDRLQRPLDAVAELEKAATVAPNERRAALALADACCRVGQWPRAREIYEELTRRGEGASDADAWHRFGVVNESLGDEIGADRCYGKALAADPTHRPALEDRTRLALLRGENTLAIALLDALCDLLSVDEVAQRAEIREQLAELLARKGDDTAARRHLEAALSIDPRRIKALDLLRAVAERADDFDTAITMAQRLDGLIDEPLKRAALLHHQAGLFRTKRGDPAASLDCLLRAYDIAPTHTPILWELVDHYWSEGDLPSLVQLEEDLKAAGVLLSTVPNLRHVRLAAAMLLEGVDHQAARATLLAGAADEKMGPSAVLEIARAVGLKADRDERSASVERLCVTLAYATPSGWLSQLVDRVAAAHPDAPGVTRFAAELRKRQKPRE